MMMSYLSLQLMDTATQLTSERKKVSLSFLVSFLDTYTTVF